MRKALTFFACTTVAAAGLWSALPGGTTRLVSADQPPSGDRSRTPTTAADSRGSVFSRINPFTRSSSNKTSSNKTTTYRQTATKLLEQAQDLVFRGDVAGARRLAERAKSFPVEWKANELSPEKFLAQLDARGAR
ncbi:MAG TPA: hypothetical protein VK137_03850, partial [Planctomycetaceae bacterium]|nr:hypothetical protein [Planctomycetaceae bacterium]